MRGRSVWFALAAACLALGAQVSVAFADGGAVRFSGHRGDRQITVFTAPTPLRAGFVDISVLVQEAASGKPLLDVPVMVLAHPINDAHGRISAPATTGAATNKLLQAAALELSEPGWWHVEVVVQGLNPRPPISFDVEVDEAPPSWLDLSLWIGWPVLAIAGFALHQWLVHRKVRPFLQLARGRQQIQAEASSLPGRGEA
jgi:hypothetical protein